MRPIVLSNATKVFIAILAMVFSFTDFALARDRYDGERHVIRRHHRDDRDRHHERRNRELLSGTNVDSRLSRRHRDRDVRLSGRNADQRDYGHRYGYSRYGFDRRDDRPIYDRRIRPHAFRADRPDGWVAPYDDGDDFPSRTTGGTYFGGLSAWTDPGNGTYFQSERYGYGAYSGTTDRIYRASRPKIIRVTPSTAGRSCSWEAGVCVIRR